MSLYEGMFLLDSRQANRDWDGLLENLKAVLAKHGAEVERMVKWGERKLAYEIKGRRRGTYVLCYFKAPGDAITAIYREVELSDVIYRALILKAVKVPSDEEMLIPTEGSGWRRGARTQVTRPSSGKDDAAEAKKEAEGEAKAPTDSGDKADDSTEKAPETSEETAAESAEEPKTEAVAEAEDAEESEPPKSDA